MARTKGATNVSSFSVQHPSRCQKCQSTNRTEYTNRQFEECVTTVLDRPVTHIERHNTSCVDCGQRRIDTTFHYLPGLVGKNTNGGTAPVAKPPKTKPPTTKAQVTKPPAAQPAAAKTKPPAVKAVTPPATKPAPKPEKRKR